MSDATMKETAKPPEENPHEWVENLIAVLIVALVIGGIAWAIIAARGGEPDEPLRVRMDIGAAPTVGNEDARVQVVIFSDFECPYCSTFALQHFPVILEQEDILFAFKHFPLPSHPKAQRAAQAAACADDQGRFWEYHDSLYAHQDALEIGNLQQYARELGLDTERFDSCLINELDAVLVRTDMQQAIDAGVKGTPTFFFNGRRVAGVLTPEQFHEEVQKELAAAVS